MHEQLAKRTHTLWYNEPYTWQHCKHWSSPAKDTVASRRPAQPYGVLSNVQLLNMILWKSEALLRSKTQDQVIQVMDTAYVCR